MPLALRFPLVALGLSLLHLLGLQLALAVIGAVSPTEIQWSMDGPLGIFIWLAIPVALAQAAALTLPTPDLRGAGPAASLRARGFVAGAALTLALALPLFALADLPYWLGIQVSQELGKAIFWALILATGFGWVALSLVLTHRSVGQPDLLERRVAQATAGTLVGLALATPWYLVLRRKQQCFCALGTFWALVAGLWSLVLLGGPFLLWRARERRRAALR